MEGQLTDPDPGCGGADMDRATQSLANNYFQRLYQPLEGADGTVHPVNLLDQEAFPASQKIKMIGKRSFITGFSRLTKFCKPQCDCEL